MRKTESLDHFEKRGYDCLSVFFVKLMAKFGPITRLNGLAKSSFNENYSRSGKNTLIVTPYRECHLKIEQRIYITRYTDLWD